MRAAGAFRVACCAWLLPCAAAATAAPRVDCEVLTQDRIDARREGLWCYNVPLQVCPLRAPPTCVIPSQHCATLLLSSPSPHTAKPTPAYRDLRSPVRATTSSSSGTSRPASLPRMACAVVVMFLWSAPCHLLHRHRFRGHRHRVHRIHIIRPIRLSRHRSLRHLRLGRARRPRHHGHRRRPRRRRSPRKRPHHPARRVVASCGLVA